MRTRILAIAYIVVGVLFLAPGWAQQNVADMSSTGKPSSDMDAMRDMPGMNNDGSAHAMHSMEEHHLDMGPHMRMTALREPQNGDQQKADEVVRVARRVADKYKNYKVALADGYKIFLPELPQKQYHFTNYWYGMEAARQFNSEHPTSLLYEKHGDDYKLIGVMYTARKGTGEDELNARIPLSVAQWHAHINMCIPPEDKKNDMWGAHPKFGLLGSIISKEECDAAGGRFMPQIFGWMVHLYPFEQKPEDIWSVQRQMHNHGE
ncbi:MAG TPA: hypothetical protein VH437_13895 [Terriglobales bacterium]|jgi:hypothetical protein